MITGLFCIENKRDSKDLVPGLWISRPLGTR
jgi:hypothetical protein